MCCTKLDAYLSNHQLTLSFLHFAYFKGLINILKPTTTLRITRVVCLCAFQISYLVFESVFVMTLLKGQYITWLSLVWILTSFCALVFEQVLNVTGYPLNFFYITIFFKNMHSK